MDLNCDPQQQQQQDFKEEEEDVHIDDNVDELFEQKMKKLRDLGLYDDRMMDKINLIKKMDDEKTSVPRNHLRRGYAPLGRPLPSQDELQDFTGEKDDGSGTQKFKPIDSGLKWSLPIRKRRPSNETQPNPHSSRNTDNKEWNRDRESDKERGRESDKDRDHRDMRRDRDRDNDCRERDRYRERERDVKPEREQLSNGFKDDNRLKTEFSADFSNNSNEAIDRKSDYDNNDVYKPSTSERHDSTVKEEPNKRVRFNPKDEKSKNFHKFFENRRSKPVEKKKTETITDIEAFIRDCNKKAEKPKPLILDDIDDFIQKANQRFNEISANLDKTYY